eukprot:GEMP01084323.1.p1 GENE.GEMP01084323.1~~GEMP01084323.1.p1  ORF type:complete len:115 (+),score=2.06 GEMP01084323.1:653-997(+)
MWVCIFNHLKYTFFFAAYVKYDIRVSSLRLANQIYMYMFSCIYHAFFLYCMPDFTSDAQKWSPIIHFAPRTFDASKIKRQLPKWPSMSAFHGQAVCEKKKNSKLCEGEPYVAFF